MRSAGFPTSWFLGLFERDSRVDAPFFVPLGTRALIATPLALAAAVLVSIFSFRRAMQHAVAVRGRRAGCPARSALPGRLARRPPPVRESNLRFHARNDRS